MLPRIVDETFPQLVNIGLQILAAPPSGPSQDAPTILHYILKTYRNSIVLALSKHQQSAESIVPWGRLLFQVINLHVPAEGVPEDEDEREKCEWWKAKKWAFSVLGRLFHRYGSPSQLPSPLKKDYLAFAEHFVNQFAPEIMKTYLHQVELLVSGQQWLSKKCQYHIFSFFTEWYALLLYFLIKKTLNNSSQCQAQVNMDLAEATFPNPCILVRFPPTLLHSHKAGALGI